MPNHSQLSDPRFWEKWHAAGAIPATVGRVKIPRSTTNRVKEMVSQADGPEAIPVEDRAAIISEPIPTETHADQGSQLAIGNQSVANESAALISVQADQAEAGENSLASAKESVAKESELLNSDQQIEAQQPAVNQTNVQERKKAVFSVSLRTGASE